MTSISVASVLQSVVIFSFIFAMSHFSCETEYAEYRRIFYVIDFSTAISLFGLGTLLLRKPLKCLYSDIVPTVFIINLIQLVTVLVLLIIQSLPIIKYIEIVSFVFLNTLYQLCVTVLVMTNSRRLYFTCTASCFVLTILSLIYFVHSDSLTYRASYMLRVGVLFVYIIPFCLFVGKRLLRIKFPSWGKIYSLFKEAAPIGFGVILGSCTQYIDKFIASMLDSHQLAVYANASADIPFVGTAITTMSVFFVPIIHSFFSKNDYKNACSSLSELFLFGWYIGVAVFTLLFCNAEFVVDVLYSSRYSESVILFRIFCLAYLFRIVSYTQIIVALEIESIIIKRMVVEMILQVVLSFVLLKIFGIVGLAASVILVLSLWSVPYNVVNFKKKLSCQLTEILPVKKMLIFFIKAFTPCMAIVVVMRYLSNNQFLIFVVSVLAYLIVNYKENLYIIKKTR